MKLKVAHIKELNINKKLIMEEKFEGENLIHLVSKKKSLFGAF